MTKNKKGMKFYKNFKRFLSFKATEAELNKANNGM